MLSSVSQNRERACQPTLIAGVCVTPASAARNHSGNEVGMVASRFGAIVEMQKSAAATPVPALPDAGSVHA